MPRQGTLKDDMCLVTMSMKKEVWANFKEYARTLNQSASKLAENLFELSCNTKKETAERMMQGFLVNMIKSDKSISEDEKTIVISSIQDSAGDVFVNGLKGAALVNKKRNKKT